MTFDYSLVDILLYLLQHRPVTYVETKISAKGIQVPIILLNIAKDFSTNGEITRRSISIIKLTNIIAVKIGEV